MPEQDEIKHRLTYLKGRYMFFYKQGNLERARQYNKLALEKHNYDIEMEYHNKLAKKENQNMFGFPKVKRLRYG